MDEDGSGLVQMEIDGEAYPLDNVTDFDTHSQLKPSGRKVKPN